MKLKNVTKVILSAALAAGCMLGLTGCSKTPAGNISNTMVFVEGDKIAEITIENYGTIKAKLFPDIAPNAVDNFIKLAEQGYYNGLKIHRVEKDMCIQGGSLNGDGTGGTALIDPSGSFPIETSLDARNFYGALGYANVDGMNTTQFYVVTAQTKTDISQYSSSLILEEAAKAKADREALEEGDPTADTLTAKETYYTNLAEMISKATDEVKEKYATIGGFPLWDGGYTVFGQVYEGFDVLNAITGAEVVTNSNGQKVKPKDDIIIESVKVIDFVMPQEGSGETGEQQ
ncbi:MAG: peptidylprolyl isomerase [Oscillospiraceae bacterium]|nr:peptidylprolyl isomerase [Oscillospiraceae bacterium]